MLRALLTSCCLLALVLLGRAVLSPQGEVVPGLTEPSASPVGLKPGMLYTADGVSLVVPPPGVEVNAEAVLGTGKTVQVAVATKRNGSVLVLRDSEEGSVKITGAALGACIDRAYLLAGPKWGGSFAWHFIAGSTPSNLTVSGTESALKRSVTRMVGGYNNCGRVDKIGATASYSGRSGSLVNIGSSASCLSPDGENELAFTLLPTGYVGMACWWFRSGQIVEGDVAFNKNYRWYLTRPSGCVSSWSLDAVAAHELGHVFGLAHVAAGHEGLTMSPRIAACQNAETTMGLGDLKGMEALY